MIAPPKIPTHLESADIAMLESALSIEGVLLPQPKWAGQTAK